MSSKGHQIVSSQGGSYSLESRLREVRGKLYDVYKKISDLESNIILLMVNPELVNYSSENDKNNNQETTSKFDTETRHSTDNSACYRWQPSFITNPTEIEAQLAECLSSKYDLMIDQRDLVDALDYENKTRHKENKVDYYYSVDEMGLY